MKERSYLSDMLPFHLEVFFVVRDVGSLGPAVLFFLSFLELIMRLQLHGGDAAIAAVVVAVVDTVLILLFCFGATTCTSLF